MHIDNRTVVFVQKCVGLFFYYFSCTPHTLKLSVARHCFLYCK